MLSRILAVTQSFAENPPAARTMRCVCPENTCVQMSMSRFASRPAICQWESPAFSGRRVCSATHCVASKPQAKFQISFDHST